MIDFGERESPWIYNESNYVMRIFYVKYSPESGDEFRCKKTWLTEYTTVVKTYWRGE